MGLTWPRPCLLRPPLRLLKGIVPLNVQLNYQIQNLTMKRGAIIPRVESKFRKTNEKHYLIT